MERPLEDIIVFAYTRGDFLPPFNNPAQESMKPGEGGKPSGELLDLINRDFGSFKEFVKEFKIAVVTQFGSSLAWLTKQIDWTYEMQKSTPIDEDKKLVVVKRPNAINPLVWDYFPLLTVDVWEHAYSIDYEVSSDFLHVSNTQVSCLFLGLEAVSSRLESAKAEATEGMRRRERKRGRRICNSKF
ncbi:unnamed protein product [Fraxinus pennsylvanica]|uniref:Manganese/iron superoxide dismutase C-terminal domain-containing protein n=1 Tax=Fraxinus pennsylvanica TaxID=56036 RepID=A0AAD2E0Y5_9LAMI|nr:unnamed protein product [Fraxinus pennsylvanica]